MKRSHTTVLLSLVCTMTIAAQGSYADRMDSCMQLGHLESMECMHGSTLPAFEGMSSEDETINLETIHDKVAVLHFWFQACPPCMAELDGLNAVADAYNERGDVVLIAFTRDERADLEQHFFPHHALRFHVVPDFEQSIIDVFRIRWGYPTTMVIDRNGRIRSITAGGNTDPEIASREVAEFLSTAIDACLEK